MLKLLKQEDSPLISHTVGTHSFSEWYEETESFALFKYVSLFQLSPNT